MTNVSCRSCGSENTEEFFSIPQIPVDCGTLKSSVEQALNATMGSIDMCFCSDCGLLFNRSYDPDLISFGSEYQVSLNCSTAFNEFQAATAKRLVDKYSLAGKTVFEIGCGNGEFLETICSIGNCNGIGIDPTVKIDGLQVGKNTIRFEKQFFDGGYDGDIGDFVCCLSVFEDIDDPKQFLAELKKRIHKKNIPIYLEVFNGLRALANNEVWSIHYEQCNYFSSESLKRVVSLVGFDVLDSGHCYQGDQYLFVELGSTGDVNRRPTDAKAIDDIKKVAFGFEKAFIERKGFWEKKLNEYEIGKVVFWGSGGKAITFLNTVESSDRIEIIVDNNASRQGGYVPGTGHPVVAANRLLENKPELVILSNEIYRDEIKKQINEMGIETDFEVA